MPKRIFTYAISPISVIVGSLRDALEKMIELPRNIKQTFLLLMDMFFVTGAMWAAVALRMGGANFHLGSVEVFCALFTVLFSAIIFCALACIALLSALWVSKPYGLSSQL